MTLVKFQRLSLPSLIVVAALGSLMPAVAQQDDAAYFSVPSIDAPELAHRGEFGVGVRTLQVADEGRVDILNFDAESGKAPLYDRPLTLEVWYPAAIPEGAAEHTEYQSAPPRGPGSFTIAGKALRDAAPVEDGPFPLVVVSHGYPGSRTFLSYLTENLASKGYVVVAIDHTDSVFGDVRAFSSTLLNRAADQFFTIDAIEERAGQRDSFLHGLADPSHVAIVGYSMGGYGALASAGAGYSSEGMAARVVPGGYFEAWTAGDERFEQRRRKNLKAIVALAPWGAGRPGNWDEHGLAGMRIPSLFIVGDQDDVSGFDPGVKDLFVGAVNSERCMLVYENARHNVGGNPGPEALDDFSMRESFDEPVWRKDRITAINTHFATAFLDLHLKGNESRRSYLDLEVVRSNDGEWPLERGESVGGRYSKDPADEKQGHTYWKGFQRRWAVGLQMQCLTAGQAAE